VDALGLEPLQVGQGWQAGKLRKRFGQAQALDIAQVLD
jgi:hypothetical protein